MEVFIVFTSQGQSPRDANTIKTTYTLITDLKPHVAQMNIIIYHRDLYQGFIQFITLIILSNIKENYSCSGLKFGNFLLKSPFFPHSLHCHLKCLYKSLGCSIRAWMNWCHSVVLDAI